MKQLNLFLVAATTLLAASCSIGDMDDTSTSFTGSTGTSSSSVDAGEVKTFTISTDTTDLTETETVNTDDEDYVENNSFESTIYVTYTGTSATISGDTNGLVSVSGADVTVTP